MEILLWIAAIVAIYFFLKQFDPYKKADKPANQTDVNIDNLTDTETTTIEFIQTKTYRLHLNKSEDIPKKRLKIKVESGSTHGKVKKLKYFCIKDSGCYVNIRPKDVYIPDYIEFQIAGVSYRRDVAMRHLGETKGLLVAEPDNPHDHNAIRIMAPDKQCVGYVPRDMTSEIRKHVKLPYPCYFYIGVNADQYIYTDAYIDIELINDQKANN